MSILLQRPFDNLVQDITLKANLSVREATGFYALHCPVCQKMDKKTGGFKIEDDKIIYNCFRGSCDASCVYEIGKPLSRKFKHLMECIHVQIPIELKMVKTSYQRTLESLDDDLYKKHVYSAIDIPEEFVPFEEGKPHFQEWWQKYMESRKCSYADTMIANNGQYRGCLAIPMSLYGKTIGLQVITQKGVYVMIGGGNSNIIYAPEGHIPNKVIVVEGTLDAKCFPDTIATLKSKITPEQAYFLRGKDVTLLPDRSGNHYIEYYKKYGWKMCIPPWEEKDLNAAVKKYGVMAVAKMIVDHTYSDPLKISVAWRKWNDR